mmetsp:Transcript_15336/g.47806  ORF Transcript_15336/g.47806 Transcript_15336/m.47806 type:complete len:291 (-) Transcript_15336:998-1870(-)
MRTSRASRCARPLARARRRRVATSLSRTRASRPSSPAILHCAPSRGCRRTRTRPSANRPPPSRSARRLASRASTCSRVARQAPSRRSSACAARRSPSSAIRALARLCPRAAAAGGRRRWSRRRMVVCLWNRLSGVARFGPRRRPAPSRAPAQVRPRERRAGWAVHSRLAHMRSLLTSMRLRARHGAGKRQRSLKAAMKALICAATAAQNVAGGGAARPLPTAALARVYSSVPGGGFAFHVTLDSQSAWSWLEKSVTSISPLKSFSLSGSSTSNGTLSLRSKRKRFLPRTT